MEDKIYRIENKIINMEKELEDMKGGLKNLIDFLSSSKKKENIVQDIGKSSSYNKSSDVDVDAVADADVKVDDDVICKVHATTSPYRMDIKDLDSTLDNCIHDQNHENLDIVIVSNDKSSNVHKSPDDGVSNAVDHNQTNFQVVTGNNINPNNSGTHQAIPNTLTQNDKDQQSKSKLFNTEGIYIHTILSIGYLEAGPIKCWIYAIGSFLLVSLQMVLLDFIRNDRLLLNDNGAVDFCGQLGPGLITTPVVMSIIFASVVFEDVKESMVEEAVLNHVVIHRKQNISSLRAVELIRICLRVRRFILPWYLISSAMLAMFSDSNLDQSGIILNFLSISVIVEADNFLGRFFFSETRNQMADVLLEEINDQYHAEDKNNIFISTSSQVWPRVLAVIPATTVTIGSIILKSMNGCEDKMFRFMFFFADRVLPHAMLLMYGLICCMLDKNVDTLLGTYIRFLGDLNINFVAYAMVVTVTALSSPIGILLWLVISCLFLLYALFWRRFYVNHLHNQEKTWKHVLYVFVITSSLIAYYTDLFVDAFVGKNMFWLIW